MLSAPVTEARCAEVSGAPTISARQSLTEDIAKLKAALPAQCFISKASGLSFGVQVVQNGGLTIKRNDIRNGFGALGDVFLILGRFNLAPMAEQAAAPPPGGADAGGTA